MANYGDSIKDKDVLDELNDNSIQYGAPVQDQNELNELNGNIPQQNYLQKISQYIPNISNMPSGVNITSGLMSLAGSNPQQQNAIANIPQIFAGNQPTSIENVEHSMGRTLPTMANPEIGATSFIGRILGEPLARIGQQAALGGATSQDHLHGAKEFGGFQTAMEALGTPFRAIGSIAEVMNPMKYAGGIAEKIRNLAQSGLKEGEPYYDPAKQYFGDNITVTPKKYLGFQKNDLQYFRAPAKKAYNDFIAEPTLGKLHQLQHEMGAQPELGGWRQEVKNKLGSYLYYRDPAAFESYQKGSDILRDKYYPYVENDTLKDIVDYKRPIKEYNPHVLNKGLQNSSIVDTAKKSAEPIQHPLVDLSKSLQSKLNTGEAVQNLLPVGLGVLEGTTSGLLHPELGALIGAGGGAAAGKYLLPSMLKLAQNESIINLLKRAETGISGTGKQAIGYNLYNQ